MGAKRMLVSMYDLCAGGHRVVFDLGPEGSYAIHKETGEKTEFERNGRTWDMAMKLVPFSEMRHAVEGEKVSLSPLQRQASQAP